MRSPLEPGDEPLPEEMATFEQQLKQLRPRAPRLDAAVLEAGNLVSPKSASLVSAARPNRSAWQIAGVVAASWMCGAVIGGACIFFTLRPGGALTSQVTPVPADRLSPSPGTQPPGRNPSPIIPQPNTPQPNRELAIASTEDFSPSLDAWLNSSDKPLHVLTRFSSQPLSSGRVASAEDLGSLKPIDSQAINQLTKTFTPAPPITRAKLMQQYSESPVRQIY